MGKQAKLRQQRRQANVDRQTAIDNFCGAYALAAPAIIYKHFNETCCLNATRVFIDVASSFDIKAEPVVVRAIVMNAKQLELLKEHGEFPQNPDVIKEWAALGAYSVVIDALEDPGPAGMELRGWSGHLVAVVGTTMVDSSSRQLSRPKHAMEYPDVALVRVPPGFADGMSVSIELPNGVAGHYKSIPGVERYKKMPGWQRHIGNLEVAREIKHAVDKLLPAAGSRPKVRGA